MTLRLFEGPAGSGKTTRLMEEVTERLLDRPLKEHQHILALTRMHGSRLRLQDRLARIPTLRRRYECLTMDSLAWRVLRRWRTLVRCGFGDDPPPRDYAESCRRAGVLLADPMVATWLTRVYPVIVIDEMQDSKGGQLAIIQALSRHACCLAAADGFQDLDAEGDNPAVVWAHRNGEVVPLSQVHRTQITGLLAASGALRNGDAVSLKETGFRVLGAPNANVGASFVANQLSWGWPTDVAVISPVRGEKADFVHQVIERVERGPIGKKPVGPYRIPWEWSIDDKLSELLEECRLPSNPSVNVAQEDLRLKPTGPLASLARWFDRQRRISGRRHLSAADVEKKIRRIIERMRAWPHADRRGVRAMTVHQAKNREFDRVVVLWPYQVQGSPERLRRLLYNAVTRARNYALVVVQNPKRLEGPPFQPET